MSRAKKPAAPAEWERPEADRRRRTGIRHELDDQRKRARRLRWYAQATAPGAHNDSPKDYEMWMDARRDHIRNVLRLRKALRNS